MVPFSAEAKKRNSNARNKYFARLNFFFISRSMWSCPQRTTFEPFSKFGSHGTSGVQESVEGSSSIANLRRIQLSTLRRVPAASRSDHASLRFRTRRRMEAPGPTSRLGGDGRGAGGELDEASLADLLETLSARRTRKFLLMVEEECANLVRLYHVTLFPTCNPIAAASAAKRPSPLCRRVSFSHFSDLCRSHPYRADGDHVFWGSGFGVEDLGYVRRTWWGTPDTAPLPPSRRGQAWAGRRCRRCSRA